MIDSLKKILLKEKKLIAVAIAIIIFSSIFIVLSTIPTKDDDETPNGHNETDNDDSDNNETDNDNNETDDGEEEEDNDEEEDDDEDDEEYVDEVTHTVFVEEATSSKCTACPSVAESLHEMYESNNVDFHYVTLVTDKNDKAKTRLSDDYNIYEYPTTFIDGGHGVIVGSDDFEFDFKDSVADAEVRDLPNITLHLATVWNKTRNDITVIVDIENKESTKYKGQLKVYVTEINSRWSDVDGNPYHFAFLDYIIESSISINKHDEKTYSQSWDLDTSGYSNIYIDNIKIIAVLFSDDSAEQFSDPPDNEQSFNAHYVDAVDGTRVTDGTLPPSIGITFPKAGKRHILDFERRYTRLGNTVLIGRTTIEVNIESGSEIEKVEFNITGRFTEKIETVYEAPYEWTFNTLSFGRYTITAKVYDIQGRTSTDSIDVIVIMFGSDFIEFIFDKLMEQL